VICYRQNFSYIRETYRSLDSGPPRYDPVWKKRRDPHTKVTQPHITF